MRNFFLFQAVAVATLSKAVAFSPSGLNARLDTTRLGEKSGAGDDGGVERARKLLSKAWDNETGDNYNDNPLSAKRLIQLLTDSNNDVGDILPSPPPLTTAERDRRMTELKLLEQLASSDDVTEELLNLWATEKGVAAEERLNHAADMLEAGQVIAAESMLLKLIDDYGAHWVEPISRLATVYQRQGRFEESYQLCASVLQLKPWHFGALEGIVAASMSLCDRDEARAWAEKGLPKLFASTSFPPFATTGALNPKRAQWVHNAIQQAQEALAQLEYQTQRDFLGMPEEYYCVAVETKSLSRKQNVLEEDSSDAWQ